MSRFSRRAIVIGGLMTAAVATIGLTAGTSLAKESIETPKYRIVSSHEGFEVRLYAPRIVAEVEVSGTGRKASSAGFRVLADYIFGNNEARGSIAMTAPVDRRAESARIDMTAPVDRRQSDEDRWVITFTMPSDYTMETLPRPRDPRVKIRETRPAYFAAVRFSGAPGEASWQRREDALRKAVEAEGLPLTDAPPTFARYDPPWTLPMFRRNEILIELSLSDED